ncbi:MAG TPA: extracellular solute-binding protein [Candidatus Limnocylindrales bacterium]|nr:extracellular solute-binding protein [Candidatus Limnocylindrales bacterium]
MPDKRATAALIAALALTVAACGSNDSGSSPGSSAAPGSSSDAGASPAPVESAALSGNLLVGAKYGCKPVPCAPTGEGAADEIAITRYDVFLNQYPDLAVEFTETDFDAQTFLTSVAAGDPPDVVRMDRAVVGTYVAEGALEPLDSCISTRGIDMNQYREPAVAGVTMNDQVWGIPEFYDSRILLINDSVVEEAGLTVEDIDTSDWAKLSEVSKKLSKVEGGSLTRIGFDPKLPEFLPLWALANGTSIISDDGKTSQLDDPKVAEALEFATSLITDQAPGPEFNEFKMNGPGGKDFFGADNQFAVDTLGVMPMEQWYLNVLANNTPDEKISFAPFKDRQGNNVSLSGGSAWVIPASARNKDAACEFMRVVTLPDTWYAAAKVRADKRAADGEAFTGVYTGNKLADERIFGELVTAETAGAYYPGVQVVLETADTAYSLPANAAAEEFARIWQAAVVKVVTEGANAAETLAQADQEAQDAIDSAQQ